MKFFKIILLTLILSISVFADEVIVSNIPLTLMNPDTLMTFSWFPLTRESKPVDSSKVLMKYSTESGIYTNTIPQQYLTKDESYDAYSFKASEYVDNLGNKVLETGKYYAVFEYEYLGTMIYSKEFYFIIESQQPVGMISPQSATNNGIDQSVPTFLWEKNSGVPYYHIFLSDEPISVDEEAGTVGGVSAIWQAITTKTSIQYGAKDPSGEFADIEAPPLMPGVEYNWLVLNNYGNSVATSSQVSGLPSVFTIEASSNLTAPSNVFPIDGTTLNSTTNSEITFKWTNGGDDVNMYEVYLFISDSVNGIEAKVNIWKGVTTDTALVFNAAQTIYNKSYFWKVYALDEKGVGKVSPMTSFDYKIDVSWVNIRTYDNSDNSDLGYVKLKAEPIEGSADIIPFASNGEGSGGTRQFLPGTYKINATRDGFLDNSVISDLTNVDDTTYVKIYMNPAPATLKGYVLNSSDSIGVGQVTIIAKYGTQEVTTQTDESGYYLLDLPSEGQWTVSASKNEYESSLPTNITIEKGEVKELNSMLVTKSEFAILGTITNSSGDPIARATVEIYTVGSDVPYVSLSTPDNGFYTFNVPYGNWVVKVNSSGFASDSKVIEGLGEKNQIDFTLVQGGQIVGTVYKREYIVSKGSYGSLAQLGKASVGVVNISSNDTTYISTDIYGKFAQGVSYGTYKLFSMKDGYMSAEFSTNIVVSATNRTYSGADITLTALASIEGDIFLLSNNSKINGIIITLKQGENIIATVESNKIDTVNGRYRIEDIPDGNYTIIAAKKGYEIAPSQAVKAENGAITKEYDFYMSKGDLHLVLFNASSPIGAHTIGTFRISSPYVENGELLGSTYVIDSLSKGDYTYSYYTGENNVLDIISSKLSIAGTEGDTITMNRLLYFSTTVEDTFSTSSSQVSFTVVGENKGDMFLHYRKLGEASYNSKVMTYTENSYALTEMMSETGITLDYYYSLTDATTKTTYSNMERPYYSFLKLITQLDYVKWNPSLPDTTQSKIILINTPIDISINGYNRGVLKNELISSVTWSTTDSTIVSFKEKNSDGSKINIMYPLKEGTAIIQVKVVGTQNESFTLSAKIEVFDGVVDSAYFVRTDKSPDDYKISNSEVADFTVKAKITKKDKSQHTISILSPLQTTPSKGIVVDGGVITFNNDFSGQLEISSRINNYGTIVYNQSPTKRERERHLHVTSIVSEGDTIKNYRNLSIIFPDSSFVRQGDDEISITKEVFTTNQKILGKYESIGSVLNLKLVNNSAFKKPVKLEYGIQEEYRERESFILSYYNDSNLEFEAVDSALLENDSIVNMETSHFSIYSLMAQREPLTIRNVIFSPNPFSPYVAARDNGKRYYGLGIKFFSSSQEDNVPTVEVEIFTMSGVRVWSQTGGQEMESGNQEFVWDGRKSITGTMCPNGRYIVKITASEKETGKEVVYKGIVVLVK